MPSSTPGILLTIDTHTELFVQEAANLDPKSFEHLARCSKAWSDATYLDEIKSKFKEPLTDQMKRDVNEKALSYSKEVLCLHCSIPSSNAITKTSCINDEE